MLIRTNALRGLVEAEVGSIPVTDKWGEISTILGQRCGNDVAALFAEPSISRSNGTSESIARWYSDADGPAVSLSALDADGRATAAAHLTSLLSRLEPVLRDPATSNLIGPIVQLPSMADVMVVGGRPVIVNWGLLPQDIAASPARRESHFRTTLGQYLPGISVPPFNVGRGPAIAPATAMAAAAPVAAAAATAAATGPAMTAPTPVVVAERSRYKPWLPIGIATAVALIALLVLLIPGVLIYPDQSIGAADSIELRKQMNRTLEEQVERLRKQLAEAVCTPQNPGGATPIPGGAPQRTPTPPGQTPPGQTPPAQTPPGQTPPAPAKQGQLAPLRAPPAPVAGDARPLSNSDLLATLENATVLVLVASPDPAVGVESIGSGFFVNDRQIVTNRHVVANAQPGRLFVANKTLGQPVPATITAMTRAAPQMREDFALLEVARTTGITGMALPAATERLSPVTAAGYTGALLRGDQAFTALLKGDVGSMPDMIVTQGIVTVIQQNNGVPLVFHTATISGGNSGGPLADVCGRLVAVNTFTRSDGQRPISFNGALGATSVAAFLESGNVGFTKVSGTCQAGAPAAPTTVAAPAPASAMPGAPPATPAAGGK